MVWSAAARAAAAAARRKNARARRVAAEQERGVFRIRGRFVSKTEFQAQRRKESFMRAKLGAPPAGKQWMQIAGKYPERFADYLQDA